MSAYYVIRADEIVKCLFGFVIKRDGDWYRQIEFGSSQYLGYAPLYPKFYISFCVCIVGTSICEPEFPISQGIGERNGRRRHLYPTRGFGSAYQFPIGCPRFFVRDVNFDITISIGIVLPIGFGRFGFGNARYQI